MIKAVLFDLGGVLTTDRDDHLGPKGTLKISNDTWHKAGMGLIDDEVAFEEMAQNHSVDSKTIREWLFSKRKPNEEVLELISKLKPEVKTGIVSNSLKTIFHTFMNQYNLKDKFDALIISSEEQVKKPDEEIFRKVCHKLDVESEECMFIDNDWEHIEAAEKLGMKGLLFSNASHLKEEFEKYNLLTNNS